MRFLICGLGSVGRRHLRNLLTLGQDDIVLLRSGHSTLPEAELPDLPVERELEQALARWSPQAVIVTNPTALHLSVAIPAAEAGCHLLIEKPISHSMQGVERLSAAVARTGATLSVGFQYRFNLGLARLRSTLEEGALGRVVSARAHWGEDLSGWHPWEDYHQGYSARADLGGGVVLTLCHPFDYLRWLIGEVEAVWALVANRGGLGIPVDDLAEVGLRFASGAVGSVHLNYYQRPPVHRLELVGTEAFVRWEAADSSVRLFHPANREAQVWLPPAGYSRNDMFLDEMRHFLSVLRGEAQPVSTLEDGIQALKLALAAHQSSQQGKLIQLEA